MRFEAGRVRRAARRRAGLVACGLALAATPGVAQDASVDVIDDRPDSGACVVPTGLAPDAPDLNNQPQGEVWIDISEDGRLAVAAKDYRFSPVDDTTYNNRVWNGLYLSSDGGASWTNRAFQDLTPEAGLTTLTDGAWGLAPGQSLRLTHETDPVVAFDRDGHLYTGALAYEPGAPGDPSALVVSRRDPSGQLRVTRVIAPEADPGLFNDKNWLAVDRESPAASSVVVVSWRLFTAGASPPAPEGGWVAVSGDGASSFSQPIRLPVPVPVAADSQFYQPLLLRDPRTGRRTLVVILKTVGPGDFALALHVARADIEGAVGTGALAERLADPASWDWLPDRLPGLFSYGANGYDGSFRFSSFFLPAADRDSGHLYAVFHAFEPVSQRSRVLVTRSVDAGETWAPPRVIDDPGRGYQLMPALAARAGRLFALWYDSRHDPEFAPLAPIRALDVYAAVLDDGLAVQRVQRLTAESQAADRPVFTRPRPPIALSGRLGPHDLGPEAGVAAAAAAECPAERYGFIGDYIGIAADASGAWAAWTDLRGVTEDGVCSGHSCAGNRNQSIRVVRLPR